MGKLVYKLTHKLSTDVEKFRAIHTWVCLNITGDYSQHTKVLRKRRRLYDDVNAYTTWNNIYKKKAFKKLIQKKRTMCTGYAYIIRELSFLAGLEAKIINGYARTADTNIEQLDFTNHSWNAIKLNGKWYLCDATWAAGYINENSMFIADYNDGYFLAEPVLFAKSHYPTKKYWLLNEELINSEFNPGPIVYGKAFLHKTTPVYPKNINVKSRKNDALQFLLKSENLDLKKISLLHTFRNGEKNLKITNLKSKNGFISFEHQFKHKGYYDVHIQIDEDIIASYTIKIVSNRTQINL